MKYYKSAKEAKEVRDAAATKAVADIICQVRQDKDQALKDLAEKFDHTKLTQIRVSKEDIEKADKTMREICFRLDKLTQQIYDLDIIIGVKLETLLNDSNIKITIAQRTDDSGDKLPEQSFSLSDFNEEKLTITTDDLYALKILKPALNYRNVEILRKEDT